MAKVAINGFGRIGRAAFKILLETPELEVVAVNDLVPLDNIVYLLRYDTVYGRYGKQVDRVGDDLVVDGKHYKYYSQSDPAQLPWGELDVDIVFECTGHFTSKDKMQAHIDAGARMVVLSTPPKGDGVPIVVYGVNEAEGEQRFISTASCTTNSITPVIEVLGRRIGVEKAMLTTVHAYTHDQAIVDGPKPKDVRRGRAAAQNIVPTSTGAARATGKALPQYEGKFDGVAVRVPVPVGSISDITLLTSRDTSVDEVNSVLRDEAGKGGYEHVLGVANDELVSSDIIGDSRASIVDPASTMVVGGNLVKVMAWYDNEWGYSNQMVREAARLSRENRIPERRQMRMPVGSPT